MTIFGGIINPAEYLLRNFGGIIFGGIKIGGIKEKTREEHVG